MSQDVSPCKKEYTHRYNKVHASQTKLLDLLKNLPKNIKKSIMQPWPLAMGSNPECMDHDDPIASYRAFYQTKQARFPMVWTKRKIPTWFKSL